MTKNRITPSMTIEADYHEMKTNRLTSQREGRFTGGKLRECGFYNTHQRPCRHSLVLNG